MTLTGLLVIGIWMLIGYTITRLWCHLAGYKLRFSRKIVLGIFGGPITAMCMAGIAFLNLIPDGID